jgi:hypothetical protein
VNGHASSGPCEPRTERDDDERIDRHYPSNRENRKGISSHAAGMRNAAEADTALASAMRKALARKGGAR